MKISLSSLEKIIIEEIKTSKQRQAKQRQQLTVLKSIASDSSIDKKTRRFVSQMMGDMKGLQSTLGAMGYFGPNLARMRTFRNGDESAPDGLYGRETFDSIETLKKALKGYREEKQKVIQSKKSGKAVPAAAGAGNRVTRSIEDFLPSKKVIPDQEASDKRSIEQTNSTIKELNKELKKKTAAVRAALKNFEKTYSEDPNSKLITKLAPKSSITNITAKQWGNIFVASIVDIYTYFKKGSKSAASGKRFYQRYARDPESFKDLDKTGDRRVEFSKIRTVKQLLQSRIGQRWLALTKTKIDRDTTYLKLLVAKESKYDSVGSYASPDHKKKIVEYYKKAKIRLQKNKKAYEAAQLANKFVDGEIMSSDRRQDLTAASPLFAPEQIKENQSPSLDGVLTKQDFETWSELGFPNFNGFLDKMDQKLQKLKSMNPITFEQAVDTAVEQLKDEGLFAGAAAGQGVMSRRVASSYKARLGNQVNDQIPIEKQEKAIEKTKEFIRNQLKPDKQQQIPTKQEPMAAAEQEPKAASKQEPKAATKQEPKAGTKQEPKVVSRQGSAQGDPFKKMTDLYNRDPKVKAAIDAAAKNTKGAKAVMKKAFPNTKFPDDNYAASVAQQIKANLREGLGSSLRKYIYENMSILEQPSRGGTRVSPPPIPLSPEELERLDREADKLDAERRRRRTLGTADTQVSSLQKTQMIDTSDFEKTRIYNPNAPTSTRLRRSELTKISKQSKYQFNQREKIIRKELNAMYDALYDTTKKVRSDLKSGLSRPSKEAVEAMVEKIVSRIDNTLVNKGRTFAITEFNKAVIALRKQASMGPDIAREAARLAELDSVSKGFLTKFKEKYKNARKFKSRSRIAGEFGVDVIDGTLKKVGGGVLKSYNAIKKFSKIPIIGKVAIPVLVGAGVLLAWEKAMGAAAGKKHQTFRQEVENLAEENRYGADLVPILGDVLLAYDILYAILPNTKVQVEPLAKMLMQTTSGLDTQKLDDAGVNIDTPYMKRLRMQLQQPK